MNALALIIMTILMWGTTPVIEKYGLGSVNPLPAVFVRSLAIVVSLVLIMAFTGSYKELGGMSAKSVIVFCLSGVIAGVFGMLTYFSVLKMGNASKIVPLSATYPLVTMLLSTVILKEAFSLQKLLATVLICSGVVIMQYS